MKTKKIIKGIEAAIEERTGIITIKGKDTPSDYVTMAIKKCDICGKTFVTHCVTDDAVCFKCKNIIDKTIKDREGDAPTEPEKPVEVVEFKTAKPTVKIELTDPVKYQNLMAQRITTKNLNRFANGIYNGYNTVNKLYVYMGGDLYRASIYKYLTIMNKVGMLASKRATRDKIFDNKYRLNNTLEYRVIE